MIDYNVFCKEFSYLTPKQRNDKWYDLCVEDAANQIKEEVDKAVLANILKSAMEPGWQP